MSVVLSIAGTIAAIYFLEILVNLTKARVQTPDLALPPPAEPLAPVRATRRSTPRFTCSLCREDIRGVPWEECSIRQ